MVVDFSEQTKKLIHQLTPLMGEDIPWTRLDRPDRSAVISWLNKNFPTNQQSKFLLESLRASLLDDLHDSFLTPEARTTSKAPPSRLKKAQYIFLAIAGTLLAICEGFDGIASILGSFAAVPTVAVFAAGLLFSALSVGIFYGFELYEISKQVGVSFRKTGQLLDVFLEQVEHIKKIRKIIAERFADVTDPAEREELRKMVAMLIFRYQELDLARRSYLEKLNNPLLQIARVITTGLTALIFFSGGFFAGQTLALTVAGLFLASAAATFWPIVIASSVVGLAALSLYWFIQRPGLEHLVSHWVGLDKANIDTFGDPAIVARQKGKLEALQRNVTVVGELNSELKRVSQQFESMGTGLLRPIPAGSHRDTPNPHTFFSAPGLIGDPVQILNPPPIHAALSPAII